MYNVVDLRGKKILITGASSGIGKATAILCSKLGAQLILIARNVAKLEQVMSELEGDGHKYYSFDLANIDEIENFMKTIKENDGALDGYVHSAGITCNRPLKLTKTSIMREIMEINLFSFVEIIRCLTKRKCFNDGLSIVGISSISSKRGNQAKTAYAASKGAMDAAVRCMAKELAPNGIRVNTVVPAFINTEIFQQFLDVSEGSDDAKSVMEKQYLGLGETDDVANMVAYLLSSASRFITGTSVDVDGGRLSS